MTKQTCGNCKWAHGFRMTNHTPPRFNKDTHGRCLWPEPEVVLPSSVTKYHGYSQQHHKIGIWPTFGTECPCWEAKGSAAQNGAGKGE